ncbi:MAG: hypothetical protein V7717_05275 [Porticoccaceae bacterium]
MRVTVSSCPHCGKNLDLSVEGGAGTVDEKIGAPLSFSCIHCNGSISNGCKEWMSFSTYEKSTYIIRMVYTVLFWGLGVGLLLTAFTGGILLPALFIAPIIVAIIAYRKTMKLILASAERVKLQEQSY